MSLVAASIEPLRNNSYIQVGLAVLLIAISLHFVMGLTTSKYDVKGKHCYVTGGSSGLGHALAVALVKRGAHVTIVARGQDRLDTVKAELKIVQSISADLTSSESSTTALQQAAKLHDGRAPDHLYLCAGYSQPQFFIDAGIEDLKAMEESFSVACIWRGAFEADNRQNFDGTYWVSANTAHAAAKMMVSQRVKGKIVFVASFLGYASFAGYTPYSPGKYALRGLADALRSEMLLHEINVHIFMPCGIQSPGYENEQRLKPRITKKIEESDEILPAEKVAASLISGLTKGHYQITNLLICDLVRLQARGSAPSNNVLLDTLYWFIGGIGVPIWRMITDSQVRADRPAVRKELEERGFYSVSASS